MSKILSNQFTGYLRIIIAMYILYMMLNYGFQTIEFHPTTSEGNGRLIGGIFGLVWSLVSVYYFIIEGFKEINNQFLSNKVLRNISIIWSLFIIIVFAINLFNEIQWYYTFLTLIILLLLILIVVKDFKINRLKVS